MDWGEEWEGHRLKEVGGVETSFIKGREAESEKKRPQPSSTHQKILESEGLGGGRGRFLGLGALKKKRGFRVTEAEVQGPPQEPILGLPSPD